MGRRCTTTRARRLAAAKSVRAWITWFAVHSMIVIDRCQRCDDLAACPRSCGRLDLRLPGCQPSGAASCKQRNCCQPRNAGAVFCRQRVHARRVGQAVYTVQFLPERPSRRHSTGSPDCQYEQPMYESMRACTLRRASFDSPDRCVTVCGMQTTSGTTTTTSWAPLTTCVSTAGAFYHFMISKACIAVCLSLRYRY